MPKSASKPVREAVASTGRTRIDAMSDKDIALHIDANPDAAPDSAPEIDVHAIRQAAGMTQAAFAAAHEFSIRTLQERERGPKKTSGPARTLVRAQLCALLCAIWAHPGEVRTALAAS